MKTMRNPHLPIMLTIPAAVMAICYSGPMSAAPPVAPHYHRISKIPLSGEGGWDYLTMDGAAHRLYVSRGARVMVVDTDKGSVVGEVPNTPGVHGIALAPTMNRGYTSNGRDNTVTVFDLKTLREVKRIPVGQNPDAILYDPASRRVFTFNGRSNDITAIDATTNVVAGTIPAGGKPEFCVSDEKGTVFCNVEDKSEILAIDAKTLKVRHHWPVAPAEEPSGLAIDRAHRRLFAVCGNEKMAVIDADSGKLLATPTIGKGPDAAAFDPALGIAFSSNGRDGTLTLIREANPRSFTVAATVPTQAGARTMAIDPRTHRIYLITATFKPRPAGGGRPAMEPNSAVILVYGP